MSAYADIDLDGAVVAITGAAQGIGRATAEAFAARGARVAIGDLDHDGALSAGDAVGGSGHHLDVRDVDAFAAFVATVEDTHGPVDVLVNNAGVMPNGPFLELDPATDRLTIEVDLYGVINGMRAACPGMLERRRGHVVNVASLAGRFPVKGLAVYNAAKYGVVGLSAATRLEFAPHGVSVTTILPSAVDTALASGLSMWPIPKVSAEYIAEAIVDSVDSRRAEIAVPGYVGALATAAQLAPEPAMRVFRRLVRDDRAMHPDGDERTEYRRALTSQRD